ncbi:hypothetical protein [Planococcus shixiaomingii]|uniref:hypothetical protein n=1 Tax=Planococcus shixiaomingii TaxID=3058393 RepID=UPI0026359864|nr:hypothetical protein [Planococcus sp. N022]WKA56515.1 hypothetical protein QWY21_09255 [Planococcus sp. N022]
MKKALSKTIQYLLLGVVLLLIFKFKTDMDITPYAILIVMMAAILFLLHLFIEKTKTNKNT